MESKILAALGIDPAYIFILLLVLIIVLFVLNVRVNMKYDRLKRSYASFMRGKEGRTLENAIFERFEQLDELTDIAKSNKSEIASILKNIKDDYQKVGIVKYDAFNEMGGNLSFAFTLLDGNNSGFVLNSMHTRDGCYMYIKEIVRGESYIELSEEEAQSLDNAIYHEGFDADVESVMRENE